MTSGGSWSHGPWKADMYRQCLGVDKTPSQQGGTAGSAGHWAHLFLHIMSCCWDLTSFWWPRSLSASTRSSWDEDFFLAMVVCYEGCLEEGQMDKKSLLRPTMDGEKQSKYGHWSYPKRP